MVLRIAPFLLLAISAFSADPLEVETTEGTIRGVISSSRSGSQFLSFKGIPFAKPPIGLLRFKPPEEPQPWSGLRNASKDGPVCIQYSTILPLPKAIGEEDCLHLNVFTPNTTGKLPVLFHIHGGGWSRGDKSLNGPQFLMDQDIVIVDTNYRLGPFGFLSFENELMSGNQGLKDQVMALRWVNKNIGRFGGDSTRVTLVGESAGAASVNHHIVSPLSRGLFSGAIAQSGSSYNVWAVNPPGLAKSRAKRLATLLSCPQDDVKEAVECLQGKDASIIIKELPNFLEWQVDPYMVFQPTLEPAGPKAFLTGPISQWKHAKVPLLIGLNSAEGFVRTKYFLKLKMDFEWYNDHFDKVAPLSLDYLNSASDPDKLTKKIKQFYFGDGAISEADWRNLTDMYSDSWLTTGVMEAADRQPGDVYFYYFDYLGGPTMGPSNQTLAFGAAHGDEMFYIWNFLYFPYNLTREQEELSRKMVKIWADFVKHGKAVSPSSEANWEKWTGERHNYIHITNNGFSLKEKLLEGRNNMWKSLNYKNKYN